MSIILFEAISQGFILGFGLAFLLGPAFFALLQASIDHGFKVSVSLALGVVVSDCLLMTASYLLLQELNTIPWFYEILGFGGGMVLIGTGLLSIIRPPSKAQPLQFTLKDIWPIFRKGFRINTYNPFPWTFWLSTAAFVSKGIGSQNNLAAFLFFATAAFTVFGTDVLKAWAAQYILKFLNPSILKKFRIGSGICLMGFGGQLIWFAFSEVQKKIHILPLN